MVLAHRHEGDAVLLNLHHAAGDGISAARLMLSILRAYAGEDESAYGLTYDSIPSGSAELRSESMVVAENQETLGNVDGVLVEGQRLTHVVVQRTHLWNTGAAAIPIDSVVAIGTDSVTVSLSDDTVDALDGAYPPWLPFA